MQLGFERREVWTLLYPSSLPRIQATSCMMSASNQFLKSKNSLTGSGSKKKQHHHAVQNPYAGHHYRQNILDRREMEIYTSPLPPIPAPDLGQENSTFSLLRSFILDLAGGGGGCGWLPLPFYSVQDCSQDDCRKRKNLCRSMSIVSKTG